MPWWSWILIWVGLALLAATMLAWFAVTLFRKLMTAFEALDDLGSQVGDLGLNLTEPAPEQFTAAVFQDRDALASAIDQARAARAHRRQVRWDHLIRRGKLQQHSPSTQRTLPHA